MNDTIRQVMGTREINARMLGDLADGNACLRASQPRCGKLTAWQVARIVEHVETHLDSNIANEQLASLARYSPCHFSRVFSVTFGTTPHKYIIRKRSERAMSLMLITGARLAQIAPDCGLSDQAHFNKRVRCFVGQTPGNWRKAQKRSKNAIGSVHGPAARARWFNCPRSAIIRSIHHGSACGRF
jgi:AraC-like DNA-binding protein